MKSEYLDVPFEVKEIKEDGFFRGLGSTFGGKPDSHNDVVEKGAFARTLAKGGRNGSGVALLWQHDARQPIGVWKSLVEGERGLVSEGQLNLDVRQGAEAHSLLKQGALKGLSIGFDIPRKKGRIKDGAVEWDDKGVRHLKELDLWEISIVTFPANTRAKISVVKSIESANTIREIEDALRDSGFSRSEAERIIRKCKEEAVRDSGSKINSNAAILEGLKQMKTKIGGF